MPDSAPSPAAPQGPSSSHSKFLGLVSEAESGAESGVSWLDVCLQTDERDRPGRIFRPPRQIS
jgi:hypothetical protein